MSLNCIDYHINEILELNLSYIPFVTNGGLFVPTSESFAMGQLIQVNLSLPGKKEPMPIAGKIIWITPNNALYHVLPGIGIQFVGENALVIKSQIEAALDKKFDIGGYTYGITSGDRD